MVTGSLQVKRTASRFEEEGEEQEKQEEEQGWRVAAGGRPAGRAADDDGQEGESESGAGEFEIVIENGSAALSKRQRRYL